MADSHNTSFLGTLGMPADAPDAETMIKVDHVTMVFNIASEQLNSLKEYAIALSRRELRFKEFRALDDVSFEVKQGDVFGILGTNGSGKSTILKIISGVLEPTKGFCEVKGSIAPLIELGAGFDLELTARENIFLNGALLGYSKKFLQQHFDEIVDFAEVRDFLDMPMKNYSSGMVARIAFAIATVIIPDVLIVDEVLSVGDFMFQQKCEQRIQDLIKEHNVTVLIVSHNNAQIERLCNKAAWIEKGHLRAIGSAKEVCSVYRAVGGRSGSAGSEATVLDILKSIRLDSEPRSISLSGENRYGTAAKIASYVVSSSDTVILTNSDFGRENYLANTLAGLVNGVMLTTQADCISDATMQELMHLRPEKIIIVGNDNRISSSAINSYAASAPNLVLHRIESAERATGIETYEFARTMLNGEWSDTMIVASDSCDYALATLAPWAFENSIPVFFLDEPFETSLENVSPLKEARRCIVLVGEDQLPDDSILHVNNAIEIIRFPLQDSCAINGEINAWIREERSRRGKEAPANIVITSPESTIDNYCLGPLAARLNAEIWFSDPLSLDSTAATIEKLKKSNSSCKLVFIGNELRFNRIDKLLFEHVLGN